MKLQHLVSAAILISIILSGCGGGGGSSSDPATDTVNTGVFLDAVVQNAQYSTSSGLSGFTDANGKFSYHNNDIVTFSIGNVILGSSGIPSDGVVTPRNLAQNSSKISTTLASDARSVAILQVLQTLDTDNNATNGITLKQNNQDKTKATVNIATEDDISDTTLISKIKNVEPDLNLDKDNDGSLDVSAAQAKTHYEESSTAYYADNSDKSETKTEKTTSDNSSENEGDSEDNSKTTTTTTTSPSPSTPTASTGAYTLLAWNDLGMHCMDGSDFSVFSILPPYNDLNAQLIKKDGTSNKHITSGVTITYESVSGMNANSGKFNTTSLLDTSNNPKTNFWDYVGSLFNVTPAKNIGLTGNKAPSMVAQPLTYNATYNWFEATGIPITPYNDDGSKNYYPLVKVTAKDASGAVLATTKVVLPISDEMDCKVCHSSTSGYIAAKPTAGWENDSNAEKDFKYNILRLHDQKFPNAVSDNQTALKAAGYKNYNDAGLYVSAKNGNPALCATCHASNVLPGTGIAGIKPLTESLHSLHANVIDPIENIKLGDSTNRSACYRCHPGATTKCLRGAMGKAVDASGNALIQCQACHGDMNAVGQHGRAGWQDEPNCQSCHQDGQRYTTAVTNKSTGTLRAALDTKFATNVNTPSSGKSMYRYSTGHGNMQCSSCHGSTHAIYPSSHAEDNLQSIAVQGHEGTIAECTSCHTTTPNTTTGGPHGMHTVGQDWISSHKHADKTSCTSCHGSNYRGTVLSKTFSARSFSVEHGTKAYTAGQQVTCYDCHNGPSGDD